MREQIRLLTGNTKDALIDLLIDKTKIELATITKKEYISIWDNLIVDIVVIKLNRLGNEGVSNVSVNGLTDTYADNYPTYITRQINAIKGMVKFL